MNLRVSLVVAGVFVLGACSGSGTETEAIGEDDGTTTLSTAAATTTSTQAANEGGDDQAADGETNADQSGGQGQSPVDGALDVDAAWEELEERWFVWGVASDDALNVRAAPGVDAEILTTLQHNKGDVVRYSEVVFVGETRWTPVAIPGGAGWASLDFLRPLPAVASPEITGERTIDTATMEAVIEALDSPAALASFVGPSGLTISPHQFIGEDAQTLTATDLTANADDVRLWGSEDGTGEPIEGSVADFLAQIGGGASLTSTEAIGFDEVLSSGNIINNVSTKYPDATIVEYLHTGTEWFTGLDWQSTTFVFNADEELIAIALGAWSV